MNLLPVLLKSSWSQSVYSLHRSLRICQRKKRQVHAGLPDVKIPHVQFRQQHHSIFNHPIQASRPLSHALCHFPSAKDGTGCTTVKPAAKQEGLPGNSFQGQGQEAELRAQWVLSIVHDWYLHSLLTAAPGNANPARQAVAVPCPGLRGTQASPLFAVHLRDTLEMAVLLRVKYTP